MRNYTFTENGFTFKRVNKAQAKRAYNNDYNGTIKAIKAAIKEMRDELRTIPTWAQYNRAC